MAASGPGDQGAPLRNHIDNNPSYLPDLDPGRHGAGTYTAQNIEPTIESYENIFGPSARDIKTDLQRYKRHGRWHLPDILRGPNMYLTDRVDGLITDATNSPFTSKILPYKYMEQPDGKIKWNVWSFDEGLASRVPYESAARTLTQSKKSYAGYMVRQGMAIVLEHNFMMSEAGRINFKRQLSQLVGSIQLTNDLDVHTALLLAPSYQKDMREKYIEQEKTCSQVCREFIDLFGFVQKNQNAMDILIEEAKTQLRLWGSPMPSFLMCNSKLTFQLTMTPDVTNYVAHGAEGQKRLKAGPDLPSYRGINIMHTRAFSMEPGAPPRDILRRRVRVAEYYRIKPHKDNYMRSFQLYNEERDTWFSLSFKELLHYAKVDAPNNTNLFRRELPSGRNHDNIKFYAQRLALETAGSTSHATEHLGAAVSVPQHEPRAYDYMTQVFLAIFDMKLSPQYTWHPLQIHNQYVYVPGAFVDDKNYGAGVNICQKAQWNLLPLPMRNALVNISRDNDTIYATGHPTTSQITQEVYNKFVLMTQSVATYPRYNQIIAPAYFFSGGVGAAGNGLNDIATTTVLPPCYSETSYVNNTGGRGGSNYTQAAAIVMRPDALYNYTNRNNIPYNWDILRYALHFRNFNRYGIASHLVRTNMYIKGNTYENALALRCDYLDRRNGTVNCNGTSFLRDLGAFFCPNHFKFKDTVNLGGFGNLMGQNLIVNFDLILALTRTKAHDGSLATAGNNIDVGAIPWTDRQWENSFLFDVLRDPNSFPEFIKAVQVALQESFAALVEQQQTGMQVNRARVGLEILDQAGKFMQAVAIETGNGKPYFMPGCVGRFHHYWYFPHSTRTEEDLLAIDPRDFTNGDHVADLAAARTAITRDPNATIAQRMTVKQMLLGAQIQNNLSFPLDFIRNFMATPLNQKLLPPIERTNFFMTAGLLIPSLYTVTQDDVLDFLHSLAWRFWGDQEFRALERWPRNPLDYLSPNLDNHLQMLTIPKLAPPPPERLPTDPPDGFLMGGPGKYVPGLENIEVVIIRPNIEHHMLGIILGQGGDSLGNTFWGQTELSCYDDSMHGIWGMSYKYHSRAVVINTKNLVRLWDIAYDGYIGGKDDSWLDWTNDDRVDEFRESTMDVSKHYRGKSMMVMAFDHRDKKSNGTYAQMYQDQLLPNWPSPIVFFDDGSRSNPSLPIDYDNIHVFNTEQFRVFNKEIYHNGYVPYKNRMPDFKALHTIRKNAALAAVENEVSSDSLAFQGTMRILDSSGHVVEEILGSGHHGPDFIGAASLRAGKGYKFNTPQPVLHRIV